jgi:hypothetical protein
VSELSFDPEPSILALALAYSASLWANVLCSLEVQLGSTDDAPVATPPSGRLRIFTGGTYCVPSHSDSRSGA